MASTFGGHLLCNSCLFSAIFVNFLLSVHLVALLLGGIIAQLSPKPSYAVHDQQIRALKTLFCGAHIRGLKPLFYDARSTNLCFGNPVLRFPCFHDLTNSLLGSNFIDKQTTLFDNLTKYSNVQTHKGAWFDNLRNGAGNREPELCLEYICTTSFLPGQVLLQLLCFPFLAISSLSVLFCFLGICWTSLMIGL